MKYLPSTAAAISATFFSISPVLAQTATSQFGVNLTVQAECTLEAEDLNFGTTGLVATDIDAQADLTVECTGGAPFSVGLSGGGSGDTTARVLRNTNNDAVNYQLYQQETRTAIWGNTQNVDTLNVTAATGTPETHTIYGRVPAGQNVPVGSYSDTITATIWYGPNPSNP